MIDLSGVSSDVFVDTNALHYIRHYIRLARRYHLVPFDVAGDLSDVEQLLKDRVHLESYDRKEYLRGFAALAYLHKKVSREDAVIVSRLSRIELLQAMLMSTAELSLASKDLPYSMRKRVYGSDVLVGTWLNASRHNQVREAFNRFIDDLEAVLEVNVTWALSSYDNEQIPAIVEAIAGYIYFDNLVDAWHYTEAVIEQAQTILTYNEGFKKTIEWLANDANIAPDDEKVRQTWGNTQESLRQIIGVSPEDQPTLILPSSLSLEALEVEVRDYHMDQVAV